MARSSDEFSFQDFDDMSEMGSSLSSDTLANRSRQPNISIFLRSAYEDGQNVRQNPLFDNEESAL